MVLSLMEAGVKKGARAIIIRNGKMAVIYRVKHGDKYFTTPGGGIEDGESLEEALSREVMEEIGHEVTGAKLVMEEEFMGKMFYYYECETEGVEELIMTGPESHPDNGQTYEPMWIDIYDDEKLDMLRPESVRDWVRKYRSQISDVRSQ